MIRSVFLLIVCVFVSLGMACSCTVASRQLTSSEISDLNNFDKNLKEIDRKYPGPQMPKDAPLYKVLSVDNSGAIVLEDGQKLQMEGLVCSSQGVLYLQRFLTGESDRIAYVPSHSDDQNPTRAYIWHVTLTLMNDPELKKYGAGPVCSPLNETALTSGWCFPKRSSSNAYNDRYEALSKIAPK